MDREGRREIMRRLFEEAVAKGNLTKEEADGILAGVEARIQRADQLMAEGKREEVVEMLRQSGISLVSVEDDDEPVDMVVTKEGLAEAGMALIERLRSEGMKIKVV